MHYPTITPEIFTTLSTLAAMTKSHRTYLTSDDCPYDAKTLILLEKIFVPEEKEAISAQEVALLDLDSIDLSQETLTLYNEMRTFKQTLSAEDTTEKMGTFRVMVTLMEKILVIQERSSGVVNFKSFKELMLDSMDRYLSPTQKTEFIDSVQETLQTEG